MLSPYILYKHILSKFYILYSFIKYYVNHFYNLRRNTTIWELKDIFNITSIDFYRVLSYAFDEIEGDISSVSPCKYIICL